MKKIISLLLALLALVSLAACENVEPETRKIKIGVSLYEADDTFIASLSDYMVKTAKEKELSEGIKISVTVEDAARSQLQQNDQVDAFITQGYDVICINMVDRTAAAVIIDKAKTANIPVVFFNREPVAEDMARWDKVYYVGAKAEQSGKIQGMLISQLFRKNREKVDKNGDGILQYVIIEGELGHQDALLRTEYVTRTLLESYIKVEKLANDSADWQRSLAKEKMSSWLNTFGDKIEVVFANNDDMALGAIDAAKDAGIEFDNNSNIIIVGIDATTAAKEALKKGTLYATVVNDAELQGKAVFELAYSVVTYGKASTTVEGFDGKYLLLDYKAFTAEDAYSE